MAKDPAMLIWLDASQNNKAHPNENFARELMELFTLGIGNYTETDVKEAARAFTGWYLDRQADAWALRPQVHDTGTKTVLGVTGNLSGEDVIHVVTSNAASPRWIAARLWSHFAWPVDPSDPIVTRDLAPAFARDGDIHALLRSVLLHPQFVSSTARTGLVKQPIEWLLGIVRTLNIPANDPKLIAALTSLGQTPLRPPNVAGWPQNDYWLTTASSLGRLRIATTIAQAVDVPALNAATAGDRPAVCARLLEVGPWLPSTATALAEVAATPKTLLTLALVSPDYLLN
jgi:uncharacterized protein (DUF1800 family)